MAFMALLALTSAEIYDNCGANGDNCFAIPLFESDVKTCIAQRDCTVVTSFNREASGMIKFQIVDDCDFRKIMNKLAALVEKSGVILVSFEHDPVAVC